MKRFIIIAALIIFLTACTPTEQPTEPMIQTVDRINLAYTYNHTGDKAVLLLHMLSKQKEDYNKLAKTLHDNNYSTLAIDFRGHGNSELDHTTFTDDDWQNIVLDVQAGTDFLEAQGHQRIAVIGASIGANAALKQAAQDDRIDTLILLSAGESYRSINTTTYAPFYKKPILLMATFADKAAATTATRLYNAAPTEWKDIKLYQPDGHGTEILDQYPSATNEILDWLYNTY